MHATAQVDVGDVPHVMVPLNALEEALRNRGGSLTLSVPGSPAVPLSLVNLKSGTGQAIAEDNVEAPATTASSSGGVQVKVGPAEAPAPSGVQARACAFAQKQLARPWAAGGSPPQTARRCLLQSSDDVGLANTRASPPASPPRRLSPAPSPCSSPRTPAPLISAAAAAAAAGPCGPIYAYDDQPPPCSLKASTYTIAGRKDKYPGWVNQDAHLVLNLGGSRVLIGVFDGHGSHGHVIARGARDVFARHAPSLPGPAHASEMPSALKRLFMLAQAGAERSGLAQWSGSTATLAVIDGTACNVTVAHVGDSRLAVAGRSGSLMFETADHTIDHVVEQRVVASGGEVRQKTVSGVTARRVFMKGSIGPGLSVSRALGDLGCRPLGVLSEPAIRADLSFGLGDVLVLASDGVWEKMPSEAATALAMRSNPSTSAREVASDARARWVASGTDIDDITAVVVHAVPAT